MTHSEARLPSVTRPIALYKLVRGPAGGVARGKNKHALSVHFRSQSGLITVLAGGCHRDRRSKTKKKTRTTSRAFYDAFSPLTAPHRTTWRSTKPHRTAPYDSKNTKPHQTAQFDFHKIKTVKGLRAFRVKMFATVRVYGAVRCGLAPVSTEPHRTAR